MLRLSRLVRPCAQSCAHSRVLTALAVSRPSPIALPHRLPLAARCSCTSAVATESRKLDMVEMADLVDVTKHNFKDSIPLLQQALQECDFVAFDCEMTGLFLDNNDNAFVDDMPARYEKMYQSAQSFIINQFGMSMFTLVDGVYEARTFNFNLFPGTFGNLDKRFMCQSSSLAYLAQHNFDFNKMIYEGIPFMTLEQQELMLNGVDKDTRRFVTPSTKSDIDFVADLQQRATNWYTDTTEPCLELENMNAFKRLLAYQCLEALTLGGGDWAGFHVEKAEGGGYNAGLRLTRATQEEDIARKVLQREQWIQEIKDAAGFANIITMLRESGKPVVGHNMLFDVVYTLNMFVADYPQWPEFKAAAAEVFPGGVYDTKHLCASLLATDPSLLPYTSLGPLFESLQQRDAALPHRRLLATAAATNSTTRYEQPQVRHAAGYTRYSGAKAAEYAHEAGFDAYMTGACFTQLLPLVAAQAAMQAASKGPILDGRPVLAGSAPAPEAVSSNELATNLAQFSLAPLTHLRDRVNVMRTDMPHVALSGPDPALPRANSLVIYCQHRSTMPSLKELKQAVSRHRHPGQGTYKVDRANAFSGAYAACWVIFEEPQPHNIIAQQVKALTAAFPSCQVSSWEDFATWKNSAAVLEPFGTSGAASGSRRMVAARAQPVQGPAGETVGNKRARTEPSSSWVKPNICSIM